MDEQPKQNEVVTFSLKSNLLVALILGLATPLILILSTASSPGGVNAEALIISIAIGFFLFIFFGGLRRKKIIIDGNNMFYGKKTLNLSQLVEMKEYWRGVLGPGLSQSFYLKLVDNSGKKLTIPVGQWENQSYLLQILGQYSKESRANVNDMASKLIEKATQTTD